MAKMILSYHHVKLKERHISIKADDISILKVCIYFLKLKVKIVFLIVLTGLKKIFHIDL